MSPSSADQRLLERARVLTGGLNARREGLLFAVALAFGLLVLPFVIWLAGSRTLGPYTHGNDPRQLGPLALYADYLSGLGHGWIGYWVVALGPALLLTAMRLWLALVRHRPRD
jgi:hypothetical protein